MLILPIKRKWFDMILSGEKKEEYRDIKPYYDTRLMDAFGTQGTVQRLLQDEQTGQIYPVNNVFVSIINNAMVEEDKGEYTVTEPLFNPSRGILWKNNVCKLRAHFRTDDKNIKVLKSLKGVDITPEVPEE